MRTGVVYVPFTDWDLAIGTDTLCAMILVLGVRIGWLTGDMAATGIDHMVLSGFYDGTVDAAATGVAGDWVLGEDGHDPDEVDYSVSFASALNPDFFVPFTNGFRLAGDPVTELEGRLDAWSGWRGIGEIIVHGHGSHFHTDGPSSNTRSSARTPTRP